MYKAVCTQWRTTGMGYKVGLDYNAVYLVAKTLLIDMNMAMLNKLQAIEAAELNRCIAQGKGGEKS